MLLRGARNSCFHCQVFKISDEHLTVCSLRCLSSGVSYRETCPLCQSSTASLTARAASPHTVHGTVGTKRVRAGCCRSLHRASPCLIQHQPWHLGQAWEADSPMWMVGTWHRHLWLRGLWQGEGASLQLTSQKVPSPSPLLSPGKACPWGRGSCSSKQTALRCCSNCPFSSQSLPHHSLSHRHLTRSWPLTSPWEEPSQSRQSLVAAILSHSPLSSLLAGPRALPGSETCSCTGVISAVLP